MQRLYVVFALFLSLTVSRPLQSQSIVTPAGVGKPFSNLQDSIALRRVFAQYGEAASEDGFTLGMIRTFANQYPNYNDILADGHSLTTAASPTNQTLYGLMGATYGGTASAFNVPNLNGRVVVGSGNAAGQPTSWTLGQNKGATSITLTEANLPAHIHSLPNGGTTTPAGQSAPVDNLQPTIALNYLIRTSGLFPQPNQQSGGSLPWYMGTVVPWVGATTNVPAGWTPADGRELSIRDNLGLYSVIGTRFGGNGVASFALPDLRGRTILGAGERPGAYGALVGEVLGRENIMLNQATMPTHTHLLKPTGTTGPAGGGLPIDNRQPSLALSYAIVVSGQYPSSAYSPISTLGEVIAFAGDYAPPGTMFADGRSLLVSQEPALFSLLGTTYGGDGVNTFNLPDLRTRVVLGAAAADSIGVINAPPVGALGFQIDPSGEYLYDLGEVAGSSDYVLEADNLPEHGFEVLPEPHSLMLIGMMLLSAPMLRRRRIA